MTTAPPVERTFAFAHVSGMSREALGLLGNHWIGAHHLGVPLGHQPIAVFDLWEHAYLPDHVDGGREIYMATLFRNMDWSVLDRRLGANVQ